MKKTIQAFFLRVLGVNEAIAKHNEQTERYTDNAIDTFKNECTDYHATNSLARDVASLRGDIEGLQNQTSRLRAG